MPTPFESAQLNLQLFEMRREPVLREARQWWIREFRPTNFPEFLATVRGPKNAWFRMVMGYWDMAASMVVLGAIDRDMFLAAHGEIIGTYAILQPWVAELRVANANPAIAKNLEALFASVPGADELLAGRRKFLYGTPAATGGTAAVAAPSTTN